MDWNSHLYIGNNVKIDDNSMIRIRNNSKIIIGNNCRMRNNCYLLAWDDSKIVFEQDCDMGHHLELKIEGGSEFYMGERGRISYYVKIRGEAGHAIMDLDKKAVHESRKSVCIGKHVWIAMGTTILGGTNIGDNSIIGAGSLTNKTFPNNVIVAGVPAKIVKQNVDWDVNREMTWEEYEEKHQL